MQKLTKYDEGGRVSEPKDENRWKPKIVDIICEQPYTNLFKEEVRDEKNKNRKQSNFFLLTFFPDFDFCQPRAADGGLTHTQGAHRGSEPF